MPVQRESDPKKLRRESLRLMAVAAKASLRICSEHSASECVLILPPAWPALSRRHLKEKCRPGVADQTSGMPLELSLKQAVDLALGAGRQRAGPIGRRTGSPGAGSFCSNHGRRCCRTWRVRSCRKTGRSIWLRSGFRLSCPFLALSPRSSSVPSTRSTREPAPVKVFLISAPFGSFQASRTSLRSTKTESESTQDQVAAQVAKAYLAALRTQARLEASQANVELAESLLKLAQNQKEAGTGTGIEVTRARVQLANERQQLLVDENGTARSAAPASESHRAEVGRR